MHLSLEDLCVAWLESNEKNEEAPLIIIEAKYMDYLALSNFIAHVPHSGKCFAKTEIIPKYFEHPWYIKRNTNWPSDLKRDLVKESPVEHYLSRTIDLNTHIITGMTSTIILVCDLIKKKVLPSCSVTLLLTTKQSNEGNYCLGELHSYIKFMNHMYSSVVDLSIMLDGELVRPPYC
jgi:hypothetical protein